MISWVGPATAYSTDTRLSNLKHRVNTQPNQPQHTIDQDCRQGLNPALQTTAKPIGQRNQANRPKPTNLLFTTPSAFHTSLFQGALSPGKPEETMQSLQMNIVGGTSCDSLRQPFQAAGVAVGSKRKM